MGTLAQGKAAKSSERPALYRIFTEGARNFRGRERLSEMRTEVQRNRAADSAV
jgi:hypothetical protein